MPNQMPVSLDDFNTARNNFQQAYFLGHCNPNFGGQDIQVPWSLFSSVVNNFINGYGVDPATIALRFVHCFDSAQNSLYLRMEVCTMTPTPDPTTFTLVANPSAWYAIENGTLQPTGNTQLFDQNYLNNFYYCNGQPCNPGNSQCLAQDTQGVKYVRNVVFPWLWELEQMYVDNSMPQGASLCFAACSINNGVGAVQFPHEVIIYLRDQMGNALLDNQQYQAAFTMKAGDLGTMCPIHCGVYVLAS